MTEKIGPFSVAITPRSPRSRYKSITSLVWDQIPGLAILTGKNGSGKTQLLEALAYHFSGAVSDTGKPIGVKVETMGDAYADDEIAYVPSEGHFSGGLPASFAAITESKSFIAEISRYSENGIQGGSIVSAIQANRIRNQFKHINLRSLTIEELQKVIPDDFLLDNIDVTNGLSRLFMAYRLRALEASERGTPGQTSDGKPLGPVPWEVVNHSLNVAGFPYEVISPQFTPLLETYVIRLKDKTTGNLIAPIDLSSGEKVLLQLVLWLFTAGTNPDVFPRLLLLDEPDAHLHPSMTTQFLDVISEVLVGQYGVRVIMTSHSPSTVALAPDGAVFQLERGSSRITPISSRAEITSLLTAGLVTVSRTTKYCFVEDDRDVEFYNAVWDILTDFGPSRDQRALQASPTIAFIAVSVGKGSEKVGGGSSIVTKWVDKLDGDPLDRAFFGIIDRDDHNQPSKRVSVLGRYSIENYLLDPINLYALLLENNAAPHIPGLKVSLGDEHQLRTMSAPIMQKIVNAICKEMEVADPSLETTHTKSVTYTMGNKVEVPAWVIDHRGHDLLQVGQNAFGGNKAINPPKLIKTLRRARIIPEELAIMLKHIQSKT